MGHAELGAQRVSLDPVPAFPALAPYLLSHTLCREGYRLRICKLKTQHFAAIVREKARGVSNCNNGENSYSFYKCSGPDMLRLSDLEIFSNAQ